VAPTRLWMAEPQETVVFSNRHAICCHEPYNPVRLSRFRCLVKRDQEPEEEVPVTSSVPDELPEEQEALFREVLTIFEQQPLPFAVAGAAALQEYTGICRCTKDLDIFLAAQDAMAALLLLKQHGFETEVRDPVWLAKAHRDGYFVDLITGMSNGVLSVDAEWIARAMPAVVVGVKTRALAPEELLASKLFVVRRERFDGADIAHIIFAFRGKLQWDRILQLAGEHWEMLLWELVLFRYIYPRQTGYVPHWLWEDLLGRFTREINSPDRRVTFAAAWWTTICLQSMYKSGDWTICWSNIGRCVRTSVRQIRYQKHDPPSVRNRKADPERAEARSG
jgi:Nucleotidyl transferase of unknown function (DUF2204)